MCGWFSGSLTGSLPLSMTSKTEFLGRLPELDMFSSCCVGLKVNYRAIDYCQVRNVITAPLGLLYNVGLWYGY